MIATTLGTTGHAIRPVRWTSAVAPTAPTTPSALLASHQRVVWRGVGPSACLADYGRLLCERVGKQSSSMVHTGTSFADELLGLDGGSAVVLLAYGRPQVPSMSCSIVGIAASNRSAADASLERLNGFRAALAGRKLDVDSA